MISAIIIIGCCVGSLLMYVIALQIGYLMGKQKGREELEDETKEIKPITNINVDGSEINRDTYEKITGKKVEDLSGLSDPYEDGGL